MIHETAFGPVHTKALAAFIRREGPDGTGRVVGISLEDEYGVIIYTDPAQWCNDFGAGAFRGDTETGAIAAFRDRVRESNGCPVNPGPVAGGHESCTCADCMAGRHATITDAEGRHRTDRESALAPNEAGVTVWRNAAFHAAARPIATLARPRPSGIGAGLFRLFDTSGALVKTFTRVPTVAGVRAALDAHATAAEEARTATARQDDSTALDAARHAETDAGDFEDRAARRGKGTPGAALLWNLAVLRRVRAAAVRAAVKARAARNTVNGFPIVRQAPTPAAPATRPGRVIMADRGADYPGPGRYVTAWQGEGDSGWHCGHYIDSRAAADSDFEDRAARYGATLPAPGQFPEGTIDAGDGRVVSAGPRSLSAAATPEALKSGYTSRDGSPARTMPRTASRAAMAGAMAEDARTLARAAGAFPARALDALADRTAAAIDESLELFSDPADPFESVRDFVGYEDGRTEEEEPLPSLTADSFFALASV